MRWKFLCHDGGAAAVEFGLLAPMLVGLMLPMYDVGVGAYTKMRIQTAAEAGAQYALEHGYSSTAITSAAQNAATLPSSVTGFTATPSEACYCIESGALVATPSIPAPPPCTSSCPDGTTPGGFVTVQTSASYAPLLNYPSIPNPISITGTATVRID